MTGSDHIVMGTDYPATGLSVIESSLSALRRTQLLNEEELSAVALGGQLPAGGGVRVEASCEDIQTARLQ